MHRFDLSRFIAARRRSFVGIAAACAATVLPLTFTLAAAAAVGTYTVSLDQSTFTASSSATVTLTISNDAGSSSNLGSATISGFTPTSVATPAAPGGKTWAASESGGVLTLSAQTPGDALAPGEAVSVTLGVPTTAGSYPLTSAAYVGTDATTGQLANSGSDPVLTVNPAPATHFVVDDPGGQTAGIAFPLQLTAKDQFENVDTNYAGAKTLTFSGPGNAPDGTPPTYPAGTGNVTFSAGLASPSITLFKAHTAAEPTTAVTAADGSVTGTSPAFTVGAAGLDRYLFGAPTAASPGTNPRAGHESTSAVRAVDPYDNLETGYDVLSAGLTFTSNLEGSSDGCPHAGNACTVSQVLSDFTGGVATITFTAYTAEGGRHFTIGDTSAFPNVSTTSDDFTVAPDAALDHFTFTAPSATAPGTDPRAGHASTSTATAYDRYGNVKTDYAGSPTLSSNLNGTTVGCSGACAVSQTIGAFDSTGHATITFTAYDAQASRNLTLKDGGVQDTSPDFTVAPDQVDHFTFTAPTATAPGSNPRAGHASTSTATAYDQYGNVKTDYTGGTPTVTSNLNGSSVGCSGACSVSQTIGAFDATGHATITFTAYKAEGSRHLTLTDSTVSPTAQSTGADFTVAPDQVDHFTFTAPTATAPGSNPRAGHASTSTATAYDRYGNVKTDYTGSPTLTSNLNGSSVGCAGACTVSQSVGVFDSNGQATITFTAYKAEGSRHLTLTDSTVSPTAQSTGADFTVAPDVLDHFTVGAAVPNPPVVGAASTFAVTAFDRYGNQKTDYPMAGDNPAAGYNGGNSSIGCPTPNGPNACTPSVGLGSTWTNGTNTATLTAYKAKSALPRTGCEWTSTCRVTVSDATWTASGQSPTFTVVPAAPRTLTFLGGPPAIQQSCVSTASATSCTSAVKNLNGTRSPAGVQVQAKDAFGNPVYNDPSGTGALQIKLALGQNSVGATLLGTTTQPATDGEPFSGIARFPDLQLNKVSPVVNNGGITTGGYTLKASAPPTSPTTLPSESNRFSVNDTLALCSNSCSNVSATNFGATNTVNASGTGAGNLLGIALVANSSPPVGVCRLSATPTKPFTPSPGAPAGVVNLTFTGTTTSSFQPSLRITMTLAKSIVNSSSDNGIAHYIICMGSVNLNCPTATINADGKTVTCTSGTLGTLTGWATQPGSLDTTAKPVVDSASGLMFFWGRLPDCPKKGAETGPCMVSKTKDPAGNGILVFDVPPPWDPAYHSGP